MDAGNIKLLVRSFIIREFLHEGCDLNDDEHLFDGGIINSLGMIMLTAFIEEKFNVVINPGEVAIDNFSTINKITELISGKLNK